MLSCYIADAHSLHTFVVSVGGYISVLKEINFFELIIMVYSEGMQYDLMLQFVRWLMLHCLYQQSQPKTTAARFGISSG